MPRRGKRKRLDRCIYEDKSGISIVVCGQEFRELNPYGQFRFLPIRILRQARADLERKLRGSGQRQVIKGSLAEAVDRWDKLERHLASWKERRAELRAWVKELGRTSLHRITADDVREVIGRWSQDFSSKTIRNRLWTLGHLYRVILGPRAETPVDHIEPPAKVRTVITPVTPELILTVYRNLLEMEQPRRPTKGRGCLRDAKTRARFMVLASTGRRPSEVMRAEPDDVDLGNRVWRVRDGKGGWSEGLYLNDDMLVAWMVFAQAKAWGDYNTGSMAEVLRHCGWPSERDRHGKYTSRPYHLRHTIGVSISERGVDLADVGGWLGHTSLQTTRSIYAPILNSRMQRISQTLDGRLSWNAVRNGQ
jgi:site-specific recombinase XerD